MLVFETISKCLLLVFIGIAAWIDYKKKELPIAYIAAGFCVGLALCVAGHSQNFLYMCLGCIPGAAMIIVSLVSRQAVGLGDSMMMFSAGIFLGKDAGVVLFLSSLIISGLSSLVLFAVKKLRRKDTIPFIPFMLGGYVFTLVLF